MTKVVPLGFEPKSQEPESQMIDHYTTGLPRSSHRRMMGWVGIEPTIHAL